MNIRSPAFCRRAWARFLRRQGASIAEIASALGMSEIEAARLARSQAWHRFGTGWGQVWGRVTPRKPQ